MCLGDKRKNTKKGLFFQDIAKKFIFLNINRTFVKFGAADSSPPPPCQFEMCKVSKPSDKLAASIMLGGS